MAISTQRHQTLQGYSPFFEHWGPAIAGRFGPVDPDHALTIALLKQSEDATTFHVGSPAGHAILKLFDGDTDQTQTLYEKERACLAQFKGQPGVARHQVHCDDAAFVMTEVAEGDPLDIVTTSENLPQIARALGKWLAQFDAIAPSAPLMGTWGRYLTRYAGFDRPDAYAPLFDIPVIGQALAVCDTALSNFLWRDDGSLIRVDFETAAMKPRGWDFIMTFDTLTRSWPDQTTAILTALSEGFFHHHKGALLREELETLALTVFTQRLVRLSPQAVAEGRESGYGH